MLEGFMPLQHAVLTKKGNVKQADVKDESPA
jgi:hypothetical protein